jgi:hypothetical protein
MKSRGTKYWIAVTFKDHVLTGVAGGFMQANHGKSSPLRRVAPGDWMIYYSPKVRYKGKEPCQSFTAVGQIKEGEVYTAVLALDFEPARRDVDFKACEEVGIRPLINQLTFIEDKQRWGYMFRFGFFEITQADFDLIANEMMVLTH